MTTEERAELGAEAKKSWNCCQAVVLAYKDELSCDVDTLMQSAAAFGSGMGCMDGTCGALCGAAIVAGQLVQGNRPAAAKVAAQTLQTFRELSGSTICRELKGVDTGKMLCSCPDCVRNAVRALDGAVG